ncbi:hypothetical protein Arub01_00740 [Actinomadura rubrobrunea]|uniref:Uncharacterized protein n=1 Tax=Actinomadura rubrobrunea TaxID=115335 RepID=A0A9W6PQX4_9ACTN|nr:hypothetical protein Arub01_00740 [Actinomadura rubrobrunea]
MIHPQEPEESTPLPRAQPDASPKSPATANTGTAGVWRLGSGVLDRLLTEDVRRVSEDERQGAFEGESGEFIGAAVRGRNGRKGAFGCVRKRSAEAQRCAGGARTSGDAIAYEGHREER